MAEQSQEISTEGKLISEAAIVEMMNQCKIEIQNNSGNKVDKIEGKGLSTNDYTNEDKEKLNSLSNYDNTSLSGRVTSIEELIPSIANEDNKLATMADISETDNIDYNSLSALIAIDNYSEIEVGEIYTLGNGAKTNQNNSIQVKCLSIDNETAIMQTYGVTAGPWPGEGDLTETYSSYFGELSSAISGVKLPTGNNANNIEPSGAYDVLKTVANNHSSFGAEYDYVWLGTLNGDASGFAHFVNSNGDVYSYGTSSSLISAPYFTLNLSKVLINDGVIEFNPTYQDANASSVVTKIETKLNNRYTKSEVNSLLGDISSIPEGGTTGQVLAKKSDTDRDVEWTNASNGSSNTFNTSDFDITEQGEVSLKPSQRAWIGTRAEWDSLSTEEKEKYGGIINITDDPNELDNKVDKVEGKGLSTNDFTDAYKDKIDGIETNADVNTIETITVNGTEITPDANKNVALTVITNSVNNLLNYYLKSETYTKEEVNALINAIKTVTFEAVNVLPTANIKTNVIYLIPKTSSKNKNAKDEYINLDGTTEGWELIGDTAVDLTGYVTTSMLNTTLADYTTTENLTALLDNKVDKVEGKGLSTNDFTNAEKTKLANLSNYDDTSLSNRVITVEDTLENKVNKIEGKDLSTNDFTDEDKEKLNNLSNYDDTSLSGRVNTVENTLSDKVDKDGDKVLSTNDYTDAEKTKLEGLSNYDDTEINNRVQELEDIIPESVNSENRLATMEDIDNIPIITPSDIDRLWEATFEDGDKEEY